MLGDTGNGLRPDGGFRSRRFVRRQAGYAERMSILYIVIIILIVLFVLGYFGRGRMGR